ncbi:MAG TPA: pyruvate ferredoxin oxidoreductase [Anaerolineae bacterium]|nr:pyruvate ferredoxin oxidoreductase [Anaerolineae bacterium]HOR00697.1 pyruvate ferredoxin oxidoreductase [Anaerolineae bacterium]HPL28434.1 pyruvate ferredoxin oxidoreductase [Anaerolineae bacterium]
MRKVIMGNHAVSYGVRLARAEVISAYPITPQTQIVEMLSEFCSDGSLNAKFIKVESEHSAMAAVVGASSVGARAFTATSSHGLLLMHEMLHWAAGARLPIVLANVNRAVGPGWNVWTDQSDSLAQRDTGFLQLYCESNQEALDTVIQAFKIAETVRLPVMVVLDAFILSHTEEPVDVPSQEQVDAFLPRYETEWRLDIEDPRAFNMLVAPEHYMEMRLQMQQAMAEAKGVVQTVDEEYAACFGRGYGLIEPYRTEGAETVLFSAGATSGTARVVVDELRGQGVNIGLLRLRLFRPFPVAELRRALAGVKKVGVIDRNISYGHEGIFASELKAALYGLPRAPQVFDFVVGLGGRDVTPATIHGIAGHVLSHDVPAEEPVWWEVKS